MQLYSCKVRLNSNPMHEVIKSATVPEIIVLRVIHSIGQNPGGVAPVVEIKPIPGRFLMVRDNPGDAEDKNEHKITDVEERARLKALYGGALRKSKDTPTIDAIFGVGTPLPQVTEGVDASLVTPEKPPKRTTTLKAAAGNAAPSDDTLGELA